VGVQVFCGVLPADQPPNDLTTFFRQLAAPDHAIWSFPGTIAPPKQPPALDDLGGNDAPNEAANFSNAAEDLSDKTIMIPPLQDQASGNSNLSSFSTNSPYLACASYCVSTLCPNLDTEQSTSPSERNASTNLTLHSLAVSASRQLSSQ
jgi:hypothetical protein